jgi:hypothetical protein
LAFDLVPPELKPWMESVQKLLRDRFSDQLDDPTVMMDAFERHNAKVRSTIPRERLLEWSPGDGWEPICTRLGVDVPDEPFPLTNTLNEWRANFGMAPIS